MSDTLANMLSEHVIGLVNLVAADVDDEGVTRIDVMPEGDFRHPQVKGTMKITLADLQELADDINERAERIPIDYDHSFAKGRGSRAAGWYIPGTASVETSPTGKAILRANVQFVARAVDEIRQGEWRYISPEWSFKPRKRMAASALTNRPFFDEMAPIMLAESGLEDLAREREEHEATGGEAAGKESDMTLKAVAESLGLAADANEETILAAIKARDDEKAELERKAKEAAEKVPSDEAMATLLANAEQGAKAAKQLAELRMKTLLDQAVRDRKITPSAREEYETLYAANPEGVEKLIAALPAGTFDPKGSGSDGEGEGEEKPLIIAGRGQASSLYGARVPERVQVDGTYYDVEEGRARIHAKAMEILATDGKATEYTGDDYAAAAMVAAQQLGVSLDRDVPDEG